jgi:hypothetical protein
VIDHEAVIIRSRFVIAKAELERLEKRPRPGLTRVTRQPRVMGPRGATKRTEGQQRVKRGSTMIHRPKGMGAEKSRRTMARNWRATPKKIRNRPGLSGPKPRRTPPGGGNRHPHTPQPGPPRRTPTGGTKFGAGKRKGPKRRRIVAS